MELTLKEKKVLQHLADGLVAHQTSLEMGISPRTVEMYYKLLRAKTGAKTLPHLIHIAHRQKLIE